jgi:glycerol-3-phosphate O-acyltransferase
MDLGLPTNIAEQIALFYKSYKVAAARSGVALNVLEATFRKFCALVAEEVHTPHRFELYHRAIREPFDYYQFGMQFVSPLVDMQKSSVQGKHNLEQILAAIKKKENVILLANHQTEIEPQVISLLLGNISSQLAEEMIFIAGHRVVSDPMAIPLSLGCNLLCIYSRKYIAQPIEQKSEKLKHNQRTLRIMEELLREGGACIYVAPSGGRDRVDASGKLLPAPFDPDSIEMLSLIAQRAGTITHFHTLAVATYDLLPPPQDIHTSIGEPRVATFAPAHLYFGARIDLNAIQADDKYERRARRATVAWQQAVTDYKKM